MKKTRFTEEQMVTILREADERPVPDIAKKHCVSAQTIYAWRKHFGSLEPTDVKRLRQLEHEKRTSTLLWRSSSSSWPRPTRSSNDRSASISTSKSTSLSGRVSPRATDPNTRRLPAPYSSRSDDPSRLS